MKKYIKEYFVSVARGSRYTGYSSSSRLLLQKSDLFLGIVFAPIILLLFIIIYPFDLLVNWLNK